ncbi:MAG: response regulator transcription factor [Gemmatimonadaceae bacterium]|nr:response regulator transcription factor [Gemmatimonadaceae bacterium]
MIRLALAAPSAMLLSELETLVLRDGAFTVVERIACLDDIGETLEGADVDVVVVVVDDPSRFSLPSFGEGEGDTESSGATYRCLLLVDADPGEVAGWISRGARAVLPRDADGQEILAALEAVHAGLAVVPAADAQALASTASPRSTPRRRNDVPAAAPPPLSPREREILALVAEGMGNKIVAARLGISEHTVKTHVASIFQKLGADTRAEAVAIGARSGVILL